MLVKDKVALIFGASGAVGGAMAEAYSREGARVILIGRTLSTLAKRAESLVGPHSAEIETADAFDQKRLIEVVEAVNRRHQKIDIAINSIASDDEQGQSLLDMPTELILQPVRSLLESHLNIVKAVSPFMIAQGHGSFIGMTATASTGSKNVGGFGVACSAVEGLFRQLTSELSPKGIRYNLIRSSGSPEAPGLDEVFNLHAKKLGVSRAEFEARLASNIPLRRFAKLSEIANLAVFLGSERAGVVTGGIFNATGGDWLDR